MLWHQMHIPSRTSSAPRSPSPFIGSSPGGSVTDSPR
jgi:hypothetical protein